jgi:hypothetical protein
MLRITGAALTGTTKQTKLKNADDKKQSKKDARFNII